MIEEEATLLEELDLGLNYVADYADAVAWTLTHGLRDRLCARASAEGSRAGES